MVALPDLEIERGKNKKKRKEKGRKRDCPLSEMKMLLVSNVFKLIICI